MPMTKPIQPWQRKRIYGIARALGMTTHSSDKDDDLHLLVDAVTGKESMSALSYGDANKVISELEHRQRHGGGTAPAKKHPETPGGASADQQKKIWAMMYELASYDPTPSTASLGDRLAGIIRKELQIDATAQNPFAWLDSAQVVHLTDKVLKPYIRSAKRKFKARSGAG